MALFNVRISKRLKIALLLCTGSVLGLSASANAQTARPAAPPAAAPVQGGTVKSIAVVGSQRIEGDTVRSYIRLRPGARYNNEIIDDAIRQLLETELFADVQIRDDAGALTIEIRENPVVNRIVLEGNKRLKEDKIRPEIKMAPRQIFTRSKVRADVARIVELYQRQGRFAATVEPKMVTLDQNRVDLVFEISEGPKSKVQQINIIGNEKFKDKVLRGEMATKQARLATVLSSRKSYDPDRLAYDQSKMRQFYLTQGYADFRVVSAAAELTPDKRDFIITYVVEEGERYKFGEVTLESELRDFKPNLALVPTKKGDWYNAKMVEDTVERLQESAGLFGYAFAEVNPDFVRDKDSKTMSLTYKIGDAPRVYVERIDINGNTNTQDKVIRREFRVAEGDAFNSFSVKRSSDRIQSLGYFQEKLEIEQKPGSAPDRIVLEANVEEKSTGELQLSAGFSSLERFILSFSIQQRNWRGKGQILRASVNYSSYSKSIELGFTEPYLLDRNIALGGDIYRRDFNQVNQLNRSVSLYQQIATGAQLRVGVPITEFWSFAGRYGLNFDDVTLNNPAFETNGVCDPLRAGRYLCDGLGKRTTSTLGYSVFFDNLNNRNRPSAGSRFVFNQDIAGLGGNVKYIKTSADIKSYTRVLGDFVLSAGIEGGYVHPYGKRVGTQDRVRLTDRYYLGEPQIRGFDIRGIGPRVLRKEFSTLTNTFLVPDPNSAANVGDALGGRAYYLGKVELEIPLGSGAKELGLRPSIFLDVGSVFGVKSPQLTTLAFFRDPLDGAVKNLCRNSATGATGFPLVGTAGCPTGFDQEVTPFNEQFLGNSWKPRLSVGIGVNWNSPFGPFRIDLGKALIKQPGDDTKLFTFNVGTSFQ